MSKCLIISRFKEDLCWLKNYKDFKIVIYNKGSEIKNAEFENILSLKNVGRESHTWLYHIVKNYNNLDDVNIFLQGRLDDLNCMAYENPIKYLKDIDKDGFVASRYGLLTPFHWQWNVGIEKDRRYKEKWEKSEISSSKIGFRQFSKNLFPEIPRFVPTSYGGCFAVKKNYIRKYDITFYKDLLDILSKHKNPIEGHYMERLWCYMYTRNSRLARSFLDVLRTKYERHILNYFYKSSRLID